MNFPYLGHGVGLRVPHYERALAGALDVDWVEVITENFFGGGGRPRAVLEAVRRDVPLVFHGVSLGIGSLDGPSGAYLRQVKALAEAFEPAWVSDHLCWTSFEGQYSHELLPLPYTEEALDAVVERVLRAEDVLGRPLLLENVSSYVGFQASELTEWEFLSEVARRSGCSLLLDLNNVIVSAYNHGSSVEDYLQGVPRDKVCQFHLANHSQRHNHKFDDHRGPVPPEVWGLFESALARFGPVSSLVEWDEEVPSWEELRAEQRQASRRASQVLAGRAMLAPVDGRERDAGGRAGAPERRASGASPSGEKPRPTLEQTQRAFFQAITWPQGARDFLQTAGAEAQLERTFAGSAGFERVERLEIYADAYFYRLLSALREMFPRLAYLTGDVPFHNLVTDYVLDCPSASPDLRRLGERLPEYLRRHAEGERAPLLVDVALLELALGQALDGPDGDVLSEGLLATVPSEAWPSLRFTLASTTARLALQHDVQRVAESCHAKRREAALAAGRRSEGVPVLVGRRGFSTYFRCLSMAEARALECFASGLSFGAVCEDLAERDPAFEALTMASFLRRWLADGVLGGCSGVRSAPWRR